MLFSCGIVLTLSAQSILSHEVKKELEAKKKLHFLSEGPSTLLATDIELIGNYNFEPYRKPDHRTKIQLVKGPLIELLAANELLQNEHSTTQIMEQDNMHDIILQLNIGLGYQQKRHSEVIRN